MGALSQQHTPHALPIHREVWQSGRMQVTPMFTGSIARAARALAEVSADIVAAEAGMTHDDLRSYERGTHSLSPSQAAVLQRVLEGYGAVFLPDGEQGFGYGVRLKFSQAGSRRLETWESEGGPAADDDV